MPITKETPLRNRLGQCWVPLTRLWNRFVIFYGSRFCENDERTGVEESVIEGSRESCNSWELVERRAVALLRCGTGVESGRRLTQELIAGVGNQIIADGRFRQMKYQFLESSENNRRDTDAEMI